MATEAFILLGSDISLGCSATGGVKWLCRGCPLTYEGNIAAEEAIEVLVGVTCWETGKGGKERKGKNDRSK